MPMTFDKAGRTFVILSSNAGKLLSKCAGECCKGQDMPYWVLPCRCHGLIVECACRLRDKHCRECGRTFIPSYGDWYEVADPHKPANRDHNRIGSRLGASSERPAKAALPSGQASSERPA